VPGTSDRQYLSVSHTTLMATKIALLLCGNLSGEAYAQNGDYTSIYSRYLRETAPKSTQYTLDTYDVVKEMVYPSEEQEDSYNCIMLTGSGTVQVSSERPTTD